MLKVVEIPISKLKSAKYNPRKWSEKAISDLRNSIKEFGMVDPLIVNSAPKRKNIIIGGHFRNKIAKDLGYKTVSVVYINIPNIEKERKLNIRLNKNLGEWDFDLLSEFDEGLLKDIGFDSKELNNIFQLEPNAKDDIVPDPPKKAKSKLGEIYQLGRHRVMCGDSTKKEDVEKLMNGKKADMVFTDPPYGVDYGKKNRFLNSFQKAGRNLKDIANDTIGKDELFTMLNKTFTLVNEYGQDWCSYYVTAPQGGELGLMMMMMMMSGLPTRHVLIWNKNRQNFSLGRLNYEYKHEPILFSWKKTHKFYGGGQCKSSVWDIDKELKCDKHPTMKPVALIENAILNSSQRGEIIGDFFLGSGSTLIAAEKTNRICYGMEIDPIYVDVIIKRYQDYTGKKAIKL